jgi:hypothetical protein
MRAFVFLGLICLTQYAFAADQRPSSAGRVVVVTCFQQECFKQYLLSSNRTPDGEATARVKTVFYFNPAYKDQEREYPYSQKPPKEENDADLINNIIRRFASPSFHCTLTLLPHPQSGNEHAVVQVPGGFGVPVMSKSGTAGNTIRPHLCYMRKPGPESAPPENQADWERLLARCLRNRREDMLDAIRNIVLGEALAGAPAAPSAAEIQDTFVAAARAAWETLVNDLPGDAPARCPLGRYELDYALLGDFTGARETNAQTPV